MEEGSGCLGKIESYQRIEDPTIEASDGKRLPVFRDLIAGLTGPAEHFRTHMREDYTLSADLRQFRG
jgi:hypothetical protein